LQQSEKTHRFFFNLGGTHLSMAKNIFFYHGLLSISLIRDMLTQRSSGGVARMLACRGSVTHAPAHAMMVRDGQCGPEMLVLEGEEKGLRKKLPSILGIE